jgi:hypothetical protein
MATVPGGGGIPITPPGNTGPGLNQTPIYVTRLAEQCWRMLTGGAVESVPKLREVELRVRQIASYYANRDMLEKYKLEQQWHSSANFIVPFYDVILATYGADQFTKVATLPQKVMNLPKSRGIHMVTFSSDKNPERKMTRLQPADRTKGGFMRSVANKYFYTWIGDKILVNTNCMKKLPSLAKINIYCMIADSTNIDEATEYIVISEVLKIFRRPELKDVNADQSERM